MARFIKVRCEYADDEGNIKEKIYHFSPLKVKFLKKYSDVIKDIQKKAKDNEKREKEDPDFQEDPFELIDPMSDLMYELVKIKHKNMTKDEFEEIFSIDDLSNVMQKLVPSDIIESVVPIVNE